MTHNVSPVRSSFLSEQEIRELKHYSQAYTAVISAATGLLFLHVLFAILILYAVLSGNLPETFADADRSRPILHGLMVYFILFPCISAFIHMAYLRLAQRNIDLRRSQLAERLSWDEYRDYIQTPLKRIRLILCAYPFAMLVHLTIAYMCHYLAGIVPYTP